MDKCSVCQLIPDAGAMVVIARVGIMEPDGFVRPVSRVKVVGEELQLDKSRLAETVIICSPQCGMKYFDGGAK